MGAWIETQIGVVDHNHPEVAPYVGAWIETTVDTAGMLRDYCRTLRGCVD